MDYQLGVSTIINRSGWWRLKVGRAPGTTARALLGLLAIPWLLSCSHTEYNPIPSTPTVTPAKDLSGCFRRVRFDDSFMESMNRSEPWPEPYQIYCFLPDGTLRTVSSNKPLDRPIREFLEVMEKLPRVQTYSVAGSGVVVTKHNATGNVFAWLASEFVAQARIHGHDFQPGDVHMAIIGTDDQPIYHRYLHQIGDGSCSSHKLATPAIQKDGNVLESFSESNDDTLRTA